MKLKKYKCTMQHDASDCAAAAISTILLSYNQEIPKTKLMKEGALELLGSLLWNIGTAVIKKKGVDIGWSWNPFDFGLDYRIR